MNIGSPARLAAERDARTNGRVCREGCVYDVLVRRCYVIKKLIAPRWRASARASEGTAFKSVANAPGGVSGRGKAAGRLRWE